MWQINPKFRIAEITNCAALLVELQAKQLAEFEAQMQLPFDSRDWTKWNRLDAEFKSINERLTYYVMVAYMAEMMSGKGE